MAAAITTAQPIDCAPGNAVTIAGSGFGSSGSLSLASQGAVAPAALAIAATSWADGAVVFTVPDGVTSATLTLTAQDGTTAPAFLNVVSQYLQAAQYTLNGEGTDLSGLASGQLDIILRDASGYIDGALGTTLRLLQVQEDAQFSDSRKIWPLRGPRRRIPLASIDALSFITSNAIQTTFNVTGSAPDVYANLTLGYFDVQTYAVGNAILLGAIQTIGFSANVWRLYYTAGFPWMQTPMNVRKATAMIATELLVYSGIIQRGFGGLSKIKEMQAGYERRQEPFAVPQPALDLLKPYNPVSFW
jgi:hypothetical protein